MNLFLGGYAKHIYHCTLSPAGLTPPTVAVDCVNASFITRHPTLPVVYAACVVDDQGQAKAFAIDGTSRLEPIGPVHDVGTGTCHVSVTPDGRLAFISNFRVGSIHAFALDADGALGELVYHVEHKGSGPHPKRQLCAHAHCVVPTSDGKWALSADLGADRVFVYQVDGTRVSPHDPAIAFPPGTGPRHLVFSPNGRFFYVCGELDNRLYGFAWDPDTGTARQIADASTLPPDHTEGATAEVTVHPDGRFVYVSNRGHDSIAIFAADPSDGTFEPVGHVSTGGQTPRHFALSPEGRFLVAANQSSNASQAFTLDDRTGRLTPIGSESAASEQPTCVLFV
jgi:6-phosphogluconolactonase